MISFVCAFGFAHFACSRVEFIYYLSIICVLLFLTSCASVSVFCFGVSSINSNTFDDDNFILFWNREHYDSQNSILLQKILFEQENMKSLYIYNNKKRCSKSMTYFKREAEENSKKLIFL